ncbi:MAG: DNA polymerase/3'-5' exonuclease PolX [Planctomycetota bacterium]|nr:DNA polymerase/3'-5' exonuclease PolX [Planctomycetota bacterium]
MSANRELAACFDRIASILEVTGANAFRVNANRRVARIIKDLPEDIDTFKGNKKGLTALDGIGAGSADRILEFLETGEISELTELTDDIPEGLVDLLDVPGLGPKTVRRLWQEVDVTSIDALKHAITDGTLESMPRMGAKTIANIADSLEFMESAGDRLGIGVALPIAEALMERLLQVPGTERMEYAGSLRRGRETIGDIDLLAVTSDPEALADAFTDGPEVAKILARGATKCSIRLERGLQVDLRMVSADAFGAALMYFTGSKEHNVILRERAIKATQRLNEYGLFPDDGGEGTPQSRGIQPVAAATEDEIYTALKLPVHPPELREQRDDVEETPPPLVQVDLVQAELHAHTQASDGMMTLRELVEQARSRGFHTIAVTDHSKSSVQANGLSEDRLRDHIEAIHELDATFKDIRVLAGSEVDILADGRLDYDDELLAKLDIVVASPHVALRQSPEKATARLLTAIQHPLVHIIGHPTGRIINKREGLSPDMPALVEAALECQTALEINANPLRLDLRDTHVRLAVEAGCLVAINTDAHHPSDFNLLRYGVLTARRGRLDPQQCVNTWPADRLHDWLSSKRP